MFAGLHDSDSIIEATIVTLSLFGWYKATICGTRLAIELKVIPECFS